MCEGELMVALYKRIFELIIYWDYKKKDLGGLVYIGYSTMNKHANDEDVNM